MNDFQGENYADYLNRISFADFLTHISSMTGDELGKLARYMAKEEVDNEKFKRVLDELDPERNASYEEACEQAREEADIQRYENETIELAQRGH